MTAAELHQRLPVLTVELDRLAGELGRGTPWATGWRVEDLALGGARITIHAGPARRVVLDVDPHDRRLAGGFTRAYGILVELGLRVRAEVGRHG